MQRYLNYFFLGLMVLGSLGLDQATKSSAQSQLLVWQDLNDLRQYQGQKVPIFLLGDQAHSAGKFWLDFNLNYVRNVGAAWGFLSDLDDRFRVPFFYLITFFAVLMIGAYLRTLPLSHRTARFALALVLSGALGNFLDRLQRGYVIDFLDFRWSVPIPGIALDFRYDFPNFNWADSSITVGMGLLLIDMLILERRRLKQAHLSKEAIAPAELTRL